MRLQVFPNTRTSVQLTAASPAETHLRWLTPLPRSIGYAFANGTCMEQRNCDAVETHDCDLNALCSHDGPGEHSCACNLGFVGALPIRAAPAPLQPFRSRFDETVQDMFITLLYQQHASHTLASQAHGPQPHMRS